MIWNKLKIQLFRHLIYHYLLLL